MFKKIADHQVESIRLCGGDGFSNDSLISGFTKRKSLA